MKIVHKIDISQNKTQIIDDGITGYWKTDIWDFKSTELNKYNPKELTVSGCFDFTGFQEYIKREIKYFFLFKMESKLLTMGTMYNTTRGINLVKEFLNKHYPYIDSFTEINYEKALMKWRTFLIDKKYKINEKGEISNLMARSILRQMLEFFELFYDTRIEYEKDIWDIRKIDKSKIAIAQSKYTLNFKEVPAQFKDLLKEYIKVCLSRHSVGYCESKIISIRLFLNFISNEHKEWHDIKNLSRKDIENFIPWMIKYYEGRNIEKVQDRIIDNLLILKGFIEFIQISEYPGSPIKPVAFLIFKEDIPRRQKRDVDKTKYIPEEVLKQLEDNIEFIKPQEYIPIVIILRATGMRISDVLSLRYDKCLDATKQGWYLTFDISKTEVTNHRIPITEEVAMVVNEQIKTTEALSKDNINPRKFLFVRTTGVRAGMPPASRTIERTLNKLAEEKKIVDIDGNIFHFNNHAFRHTKAVELINNGMNLIHVQKWLAHSSPEMTLRYARVLDITMRKSWENVMKKGIFKVNTENGKIQKIDIDSIENNDLIEWEYIRHNLDAVRIPLGFCLKPSKIQCNNQLNPCLICSNMCTSPEFIHEFDEEIIKTKNQIDRAKILGRNIWVEKNQTVLERLEAIVAVLRDGKVYHKAGKNKREYIGDERNHVKYN